MVRSPRSGSGPCNEQRIPAESRLITYENCVVVPPEGPLSFESSNISGYTHRTIKSPDDTLLRTKGLKSLRELFSTYFSPDH